ncbi:MAG: flagellar motor protein MotB [Pseudomonadota bacterium]
MAIYSSTRSGRGRSLRRGESRRPGQWKLAYADFLTALMAFFLLMWLSTEQSVINREQVAAYFSGRNQTAETTSTQLAAIDHLLDEIAIAPGLAPYQGQIVSKVAGDKLRLEVTDASSAPLFETAGSEPSKDGKKLLSVLGTLIEPHSLNLRIEGHTDAFPAMEPGMSNWEISSARANAARKLLQDTGLPEARIRAVIGLADAVPLLPNQPHASVNRRISIILEDAN